MWHTLIRFNTIFWSLGSGLLFWGEGEAVNQVSLVKPFGCSYNHNQRHVLVNFFITVFNFLHKCEIHWKTTGTVIQSSASETEEMLRATVDFVAEVSAVVVSITAPDCQHALATRALKLVRLTRQWRLYGKSPIAHHTFNNELTTCGHLFRQKPLSAEWVP